jgi:hypothetical protein
MKQIAALLLAGATLLTAGGTAAAEPSDGDPAVTQTGPAARYAFGVRAGGYGFRNTQHAELGEWDDCRMDGAGVFAQRTLTRHLFAEVGFDLYTAKEATAMPGAVGAMDRISGITTVAGGARIPWRWVQPYAQLGIGIEVTRVEMPAHGLEDRAVLPMGFLGFGAELFATEHLSIGANVRTNLMKHYEHGADGHSHEGGDPAHTEMSGELDAAAQGQLFLKYQI